MSSYGIPGIIFYYMINLNNVKMNVIETSENGVVNQDTIFSFNQEQDLVYANYSGGQIAKGFLVGYLKGNKLEFTYGQVQVDGILDSVRQRKLIKK